MTSPGRALSIAACRSPLAGTVTVAADTVAGRATTLANPAIQPILLIPPILPRRSGVIATIPTARGGGRMRARRDPATPTPAGRRQPDASPYEALTAAGAASTPSPHRVFRATVALRL